MGEVGEGLLRLKRRVGGVKSDRVPVPVRSGRYSPLARIKRMRLRYWSSSWGGRCCVGSCSVCGGETDLSERWTPGSRVEAVG